MYGQAQLFDARIAGFAPSDSASAADQLKVVTGRASRYVAGLLGDERPSNVLALLTIFVVSTHLLALMIFLARSEITKPPQPLPMTVSLISLAPAPQIQPLPQLLPQPVKPEVKPVVKKQVVKPLTKPLPKRVQPTPVPVAQETPVSDAPVPPPMPAAAPIPVPAKPAAPAVTEADYRANYAINPRPVYPSVARSHGWQGKVALRVAVTADGLAASVSVERGSGYEVLDEAAVEAVKQWRFVPAKHGDTAVASSVVVPLSFALREEQ